MSHQGTDTAGQLNECQASPNVFDVAAPRQHEELERPASNNSSSPSDPELQPKLIEEEEPVSGNVHGIANIDNMEVESQKNDTSLNHEHEIDSNWMGLLQPRFIKFMNEYLCVLFLHLERHLTA